MRTRTALLLAFSALLAACAPLATHFPGESRDAQLVRDIAQANLAEIAAGRLAVSKARSRAARELGRRMVAEHTRLQADGSELKSAKGIPLPTRPSEAQEAALRTLERTPRASFDRAYVALTLESHDALLRLLERAVSQARDPALRLHAERAIPRIRRHLDSARIIGGWHSSDPKATRAP